MSLGASISRFTWASDSSPLMASRLWPKATRMPIAPTSRGRCSSHPADDCLVGSRLVWVKTGCHDGTCTPAWCRASVRKLQPRISTPMTVVSCMIRRALSLDSWTPMMFSRQKYSVMPTATITVRQLTVPGWAVASSTPADPWASLSMSPNSPTMYCPAATALIGPVRM